jgi:Cu-Zn family superoxide dismutase
MGGNMRIERMLIGCISVALGSSPLWADHARAKIAGTTATTPVNGMVTLEDTQDGLKIDAQITQAPAGKHGFHIHEFGLCEDEGKAAGGHYNPAGHPHGDLLKEGIAKTHAGDFGNITIGDDGKGSLQAVIPHLALNTGKYTVAGRAFILHEKADDFSQPVGNAGARIGCGPILITKD